MDFDFQMCASVFQSSLIIYILYNLAVRGTKFIPQQSSFKFNDPSVHPYPRGRFKQASRRQAARSIFRICQLAKSQISITICFSPKRSRSIIWSKISCSPILARETQSLVILTSLHSQIPINTGHRLRNKMKKSKQAAYQKDFQAFHQISAHKTPITRVDSAKRTLDINVRLYDRIVTLKFS